MKRTILHHAQHLKSRTLQQEQQQVNSLLNFVNRNANRKIIIGKEHFRMLGTSNGKLLSRMFENDQEQQAYEREKERLFRESQNQQQQQQQQGQRQDENSDYNFQTNQESTGPSIFVTGFVFGCIWYGIRYLLEKAQVTIKENEYFEWLSKGNFNEHDLSATDEARIISLLTDIKTLLKERIVMEEFYNQNFVKNIFKLSLSKNNILSEPALELLSLIFKSGSPPRLAETFYKISTQTKEFNIIRIVIDNIKAFQSTSAHISFEELAALASKSSREVTTADRFQKSPDMNQTRAIVLREKRSLSLLAHFFGNKHLLQHFLDDETYKNDIINMFSKGNDLEKFVALICVNGIVLSSLTKSRMKPLSETNPKLVDAMNQASSRVGDQYFKHHVSVIGKYIDGMSENNLVVQLKAPNSTNLVGSALISFICYLHLKHQKRITIPKAMLKGATLFAYSVYYSTYQRNFANFLSDQTHKKNSEQPLQLYNTLWNQSEYNTILLNGVLWAVAVTVVGNWFAIAPLILF